jgi:hypothetical protein
VFYVGLSVSSDLKLKILNINIYEQSIFFIELFPTSAVSTLGTLSLSAYDFVHSDKIYFTDGSLC